MAHYLHLIESTTLFGGTTLMDFDLDNSGGSSKYRLLSFKRGKPQFKDTWADSPMRDGKRLVAYRMALIEEEIQIAIESSTLDDLLYRKSILDAYLLKARDAQVARNNGGSATYFWLADRPLNSSTKTYKCEIIAGEAELPDDFYDTNMLAYLAEPVTIRLLRAPYVSASTLTILNGVSATNGYSDYVDIGASGGTAITGDLPAPLSVKVVGGDTTTTRLLMALRMRGTPSNFKHVYWAKDATLGATTAARNTDTTFDGNNTTNGSRTTATNTTETKILRFVNTTNVADQYGRFHAYARCRSNTAGRYSLRLKVGRTDGTNDVFPASGGFVTDTAQSVGTDSGNALAWVDLGEFEFSFTATVYGLLYELWATCSDTTGSPTLDCDGIFLFPVGEGPVGTGLVQATFALATAASGVNNAVISAIPGDERATLANASDVATFSVEPDAGAPLYGIPERAARIYIVLLDGTNTRHNHSHTLTVTVKHELRHSNVIGV